MTTSSSSVPVLGPVLYFTSTDGYSYDVDNRPILQLDTNLRHINTSLVGLGYGEHASLAGGLLSAGRAVLLSSNGSVFYPTTGSPSVSNPTENIVGLVIGTTDSGLNRVIWSSKHLDLDTLGLSAISSGNASGSYLVTSVGELGILRAVSSPNLTTEYVLGRIKSGPYIEVNTSTDLVSSNAAIAVGNTVKDNHANMYGLTRFRNLLMFMDTGSTPVQYTKTTYRQSDYSGDTNPMNAILSSNRDTISSAGVDSIIYDTALVNKVIKERYTQFLTAGSSDLVECDAVASSWATSVYSTSLVLSNNSENYELQQLTGGVNYNNDVPLFKSFTIDKYYQYTKVITSDPTYAKVQATATVFNPLNTADLGGEMTRIIVWDFFEYNSTTGLETAKHRIILTGESAENALDSAFGIFPTLLVNLA